MRIIFLGDIVGSSGVSAVTRKAKELRKRYEADLLIANGENASNGTGITPQIYRNLCESGVDGVTLGDHCFKKKQIAATLNDQSNIIRPANLPAGAWGKGMMKLQVDGRPPVVIMTVLGRLFMGLNADDPFACVERLMESPLTQDAIVIVEVHAEATSEKQAMGWQFNGRVAAVLGTHTHVPTADTRVLPPAPNAKSELTAGGTAYMSDLGMTGPHESVLGRQIDRVLTYMTTGTPAAFDVAMHDVRINGAVIDIDNQSKRATKIERIEVPVED